MLPAMGEYNFYRLRDLKLDEAWVDDAIVRAGGYRLSQKHTFPHSVKNCDYRLGRLLIDLKILEQDAFDSPERREKLMRFFETKGILPPTGNVTIDSRTLPEEILRDYWPIYLSNLERLAAKTNKQVKDTAAHLGLTGFRGMLLVANKDCETVDGHTIRHYLNHLIKKESYSSLHYGMCFMAIPAVAEGHSPVIGMHSSEPEPEDAATFDVLAKAFKTKIEELLGKELKDAPRDMPPVYNVRDHRTHVVGDARVTLLSNTIGAAKQNESSMKPIPHTGKL